MTITSLRGLGTALVILASLSASGTVHADVREFDAFSYRQANLQKQVVILDFHTKFCPRCRGMSPILEGVLTQKRMSHVKAFLVDFDRDFKLRQKYDVRYKTTVIFLFQGKEIERVTGEIQHEALEDAIRAGLDRATGKVSKL